MAKYTLAAALALVVIALPAMAAQGSRVVGCRERCDRNPCQASPAVCKQARDACLAECKE